MDMKNKNDFRKFKRFARGLRITMDVFFWAVIVAAAGALIGVAVIQAMKESNFVFPASSMGSISLQVDGMIKYRLDSQVPDTVNLKNVFTWILFLASVVSVLIAPIFYQLSKILKNVEQDRPFDARNADRLFVIGTVMIIASFVVRLAEYIVFDMLITTLKITNIELNLMLDGTMVIVGMLILLLGGIFKYGSYLQQEYDETV